MYPVLTTLITYPSHLDRAAQVRGDFSWRDFWWGVGGGGGLEWYGVFGKLLLPEVYHLWESPRERGEGGSPLGELPHCTNGSDYHIAGIFFIRKMFHYFKLTEKKIVLCCSIKVFLMGPHLTY